MNFDAKRAVARDEMMDGTRFMILKDVTTQGQKLKMKDEQIRRSAYSIADKLFGCKDADWDDTLDEYLTDLQKSGNKRGDDEIRSTMRAVGAIAADSYSKEMSYGKSLFSTSA